MKINYLGNGVISLMTVSLAAEIPFTTKVLLMPLKRVVTL